MPTYALLGATGATGSSVLRYLLAEPPKNLKLNILIRSKSKLLKLFPKIEETAAFETNIFQGTSTDAAAMERCLTGVHVVLMCVGTNESHPRNTLMYDTAASLVDALKTVQKTTGDDYRTPSVLWLRAAPVNPIFCAQMPAPVRFITWSCLYFAYVGDEKSSSLLESASKESPGLLHTIMVDPPGLVDADGTERTGYKLVVTEVLGSVLSYADLGAAFCELAERREEFDGKAVGVSATGKVKMTWGTNLWYISIGAKNRILHAAGLI